MKNILLCSDLDRTLIPNGTQGESPQARPALLKLAAHPNLQLAYVSGRDRQLVKNAISEFGLPKPDFVIGDVGTTLYHLAGEQWQLDQTWQHELARDWRGRNHDDIAGLLVDLKHGHPTLQPPEKQNAFKISFYTNIAVDARKLKEDIAEILNNHNVRANIIWSRDDAEHIGLLDILPSRANKLQAIRFLMATKGIREDAVVFAGDSGNDLDVLTSGLPSILVRNAADDVRQTAVDQLSGQGWEDRLYSAKGGFGGMNGNYSAGVIEGVAHFFPEMADWINVALKPE